MHEREKLIKIVNTKNSTSSFYFYIFTAYAFEKVIKNPPKHSFTLLYLNNYFSNVKAFERLKGFSCY